MQKNNNIKATPLNPPVPRTFACAQLYIHCAQACEAPYNEQELFIAWCTLIVCQAQQVQKD